MCLFILECKEILSKKRFNYPRLVWTAIVSYIIGARTRPAGEADREGCVRGRVLRAGRIGRR